MLRVVEHQGLRRGLPSHKRQIQSRLSPGSGTAGSRSRLFTASLLQFDHHRAVWLAALVHQLRCIFALIVPDHVAGLALLNGFSAGLRIGALITAIVQKYDHLIVRAHSALADRAWGRR